MYVWGLKKYVVHFEVGYGLKAENQLVESTPDSKGKRTFDMPQKV